jgi:predicted nucleic acid-binding protein
VSSYLIDTNVISEFARPVPNPAVTNWLQKTDPSALFVSVMTFGEIRMGIENMPASKRRADLEDWLALGLPGWFSSNLLQIAKEIADRWGRLTIQAKRKGMMLTTTDGLIAATAFDHDLTLVTRNVKDFAGLGLTIVDPWLQQP